MYFFPHHLNYLEKKEDFFFFMGRGGKWTELSSGPMDLVIVIILKNGLSYVMKIEGPARSEAMGHGEDQSVEPGRTGPKGLGGPECFQAGKDQRAWREEQRGPKRA